MSRIPFANGDYQRKQLYHCETQQNIQIIIKGIAGSKGEYVAYYRSEFLDAAFSVCFQDNIVGAVALKVFRRGSS